MAKCATHRIDFNKICGLCALDAASVPLTQKRWASMRIRIKELEAKPTLLNQDLFGVCGMTSIVYELLKHNKPRFEELCAATFGSILDYPDSEFMLAKGGSAKIDLVNLAKFFLESTIQGAPKVAYLVDFLTARALAQLLKTVNKGLYDKQKVFSDKFDMKMPDGAKITAGGHLAITAEIAALSSTWPLRRRVDYLAGSMAAYDVQVSRVAYLTDVEGRWEKLASFFAANPDVGLDAGGRIKVREGVVFVFGGDAVDRGPAGRRIVGTLLEAKLRQPEQIVLLAGNRDVNKMRLVRELRGLPNPKLPPEVRKGSRAEILRCTFERTMGASKAFENRRTELIAERRPAGDEDVVESYLEDLAPEGLHTRYLERCQLSYREGGTFFVHGAVTDANFGHVPDGQGPTPDLSEWMGRLEAFYAREVKAFIENDPLAADPGWLGVVAYQAPLVGTKDNQSSVIYGRPTDEQGNPCLPSALTRARLLGAGVHRVVVGHTPSGDCPAVVRGGDFELVMADNSYGRVELGSHVALDDDALRVEGHTVLDGGDTLPVKFELRRDERGPIGLRDRENGRLIKGRLERGEYLSFYSFEPGRVEQHAVSGEALAKWALVA